MEGKERPARPVQREGKEGIEGRERPARPVQREGREQPMQIGLGLGLRLRLVQSAQPVQPDFQSDKKQLENLVENRKGDRWTRDIHQFENHAENRTDDRRAREGVREGVERELRAVQGVVSLPPLDRQAELVVAQSGQHAPVVTTGHASLAALDPQAAVGARPLNTRQREPQLLRPEVQEARLLVARLLAAAGEDDSSDGDFY
ncbi:hypothetical protein T492DRAFT_1029880 [Pavlovales sp. CCMP2436]|nr:hypothetical protein T492DRAFT_1029880 [Pavlovales sp. CCMP2436]